MKKHFGKKIATASILCSIMLMVLSCKSVKFDLDVYSPIAILTVYSNPSLPWYDPQAKSSNAVDDSLPGTLLKKQNQENPELYTVQERIDSAYKTLADSLSDSGINLIDSTSFTGGEEYQKAAKVFLSSLETDVPAEGLKVLDYINGKKYRQLAQSIGAEGIMLVEFNFYKQKLPVGMHDIFILARTTMNVYIYDAEGNKVFHKKYTAVSETGPQDDNGSYNKHELIAKYPETVESVVQSLVQDLHE